MLIPHIYYFFSHLLCLYFVSGTYVSAGILSFLEIFISFQKSYTLWLYVMCILITCKRVGQIKKIHVQRSFFGTIYVEQLQFRYIFLRISTNIMYYFRGWWTERNFFFTEGALQVANRGEGGGGGEGWVGRLVQILLFFMSKTVLCLCFQHL